MLFKRDSMTNRNTIRFSLSGSMAEFFSIYKTTKTDFRSGRDRFVPFSRVGEQRRLNIRKMVDRAVYNVSRFTVSLTEAGSRLNFTGEIMKVTSAA